MICEIVTAFHAGRIDMHDCVEGVRQPMGQLVGDAFADVVALHDGRLGIDAD